MRHLGRIGRVDERDRPRRGRRRARTTIAMLVDPMPVTIQPPSWRWIVTLLAVVFGVVARRGDGDVAPPPGLGPADLGPSWRCSPRSRSSRRSTGSLAVDGAAGSRPGRSCSAVAVFAVVMVALMIPLVVDQLRALIEAAPDILDDREPLHASDGSTSRSPRPRSRTAAQQRRTPTSRGSRPTSRATCSASPRRSSARSSCCSRSACSPSTSPPTARASGGRCCPCCRRPASSGCCGRGRWRSRRPGPTSTPGCCWR